MSWLLEGATDREEVLALHHGLAADHQRILDELWRSAVSPVILELVRLRTATLLGNTAAWAEPRSAAALDAGFSEELADALPRWNSDDRFDTTTRLCLTLAEQYVLDVHGITDQLVDDVRAAIGPDGVVTLTTALATWEISHRFDNALFEPTATDTASTEGER